VHIYLPIAESSVNALFIIIVGFISGSISGFFGVSGSFIGVPVLVSYGLESIAAVSAFINVMLTTSFVAFKEDLNEKTIDFNIIKINFLGSIAGVIIGIFLFKILSKNGYIDMVVLFLYIFVLGSISIFMLFESFVAYKKKKYKNNIQKYDNNYIEDELKIKKKDFFERLDIFPYKIKLENNANISIFFITFFSFFAGALVAIAGVSSGLIMIPVMTYIYKMNIRSSIATSNFNGGLIALFSNILQIITVKKTDLILSLLLLIGSIFGLLIARKLSTKLQPEVLRISLAFLMFIIIMKMIFGILFTPEKIFLISTLV
jgi:uncharacterized membrane protein YfcA